MRLDQAGTSATYWVKTSTDSPSARMIVEQVVERGELARAARRAGPVSCRNCAGWLQICFSAVSSLSTSPRRSMPSALFDRGEALGDHRLVQRCLLGGQRHDPVGLGLGAATPARSPDRTCGAAAGTAGPAGRAARSASASRKRSTGTATVSAEVARAGRAARASSSRPRMVLMGTGRVAHPPAKTGRKPALVNMRATVSR